jgi:hypothetical protein
MLAAVGFVIGLGLGLVIILIPGGSYILISSVPLLFSALVLAGVHVAQGE